MKAIVLHPAAKSLTLADRPEPSISHPHEIKLRVRAVGICGTDRRELSTGDAALPPGAKELIIGHEMFGQVVEVGSAVRRVKPGDYALFTVRRGCGKCMPCAMNRSDMCLTGEYKERGIKEMDGYQTEYVVDTEPYIVHVPHVLEEIAVLCEPLSVVEKAIHEALAIQKTRLPDAPVFPDWLHGRRCLIAGIGPIGLLASMVLCLHGAEVYGMDVVEPDSARPKWLESIGGHYIDGRKVKPDNIDDAVAPMELIIEATGVPSLQFNLLDALTWNGIYVVTGVPGGDRPLQIPGAEIMRKLVLSNNVMVGSVNAARGYFEFGITDLTHAHLRWGALIRQLITHRYTPDNFLPAFTEHGTSEIKTIVQWNSHTG